MLEPGWNWDVIARPITESFCSQDIVFLGRPRGSYLPRLMNQRPLSVDQVLRWKECAGNFLVASSLLVIKTGALDYLSGKTRDKAKDWQVQGEKPGLTDFPLQVSPEDKLAGRENSLMPPDTPFSGEIWKHLG